MEQTDAPPSVFDTLSEIDQARITKTITYAAAVAEVIRHQEWWCSLKDAPAAVVIGQLAGDYHRFLLERESLSGHGPQRA